MLRLLSFALYGPKSIPQALPKYGNPPRRHGDTEGEMNSHASLRLSMTSSNFPPRLRASVSP